MRRYRSYRRWSRDDLIDRILRTLQLALDTQGRINGALRGGPPTDLTKHCG